MPIQSLPDDDLKKLALDIFAGRVFTHRHVQRPSNITAVFMPLALLDHEQLAEFQENAPGLIYEYLSEAAPRSCNGMPMFLSMKMLNQVDTFKVFQIIAQLKSSVEAIQVESEPV